MVDKETGYLLRARVRRTSSWSRPLPAGDLFPALGPLARAVVLADFVDDVELPSDDAWRAECGLLVRQRLAATALRLARQHQLSLPHDVQQVLRRAEFDWAHRAHQALRRSTPALDALRTEGIDFVVTKGPAIAAFYPRPQERPYSDLDVLVRARDFGRALAVLARLGFDEQARNRQPWRVFNRWCREAMNVAAPDGGSVDVHHRIPPWFWTAGLDPERLLLEAGTQSSMGAWFRRASPRHNLLIAALHVFSDHNLPGHTLLAWRDVLTLAAACEPDGVAAEAEEVGLAGWLLWILLALPEPARPQRLLAALEDADPHLPGSWRLRLALPPRVGSRHLVGQALRLPAPQGLLYLAGMAVPSPQFLRQKFPDGRARYLRWWAETSQRLNHVLTQ